MNNSPNKILADNDLHIHFSADRWELVSTELNSPTTLISATATGLIAHPVFVEARHLPNATLSPAQIARIVLGWATENDAWRLGMLLVDSNASGYDTTQMRWCELAAWSANNESDAAVPKQAAQSLARLINRPFQFIEPHGQSRVPIFSRSESMFGAAGDKAENLSPTPLTTSAAPSADPINHNDYPTIPLISLPLRVDNWRLVLSADGIRWQRLSNWWLSNLGRLAIYAAIAALFIILGIGSRTSGFADVDPSWLPTAGLLIAAVLFANMGLILIRMLRAEVVGIDTHKRELYSQGIILPFISWRMNFDDIDYLVVTQTPARSQGRRSREDPMNIAQEVWIHVAKGEEFKEIVALGTVEGRSWVWENVRNHPHYELRRRLFLAEYDTPAHHAALHMAERIGTIVYLDLTS